MRIAQNLFKTGMTRLAFWGRRRAVHQNLGAVRRSEKYMDPASVLKSFPLSLNDDQREQQLQIILALGQEEILSQCAEECCELGQAAEKMRRVLRGTTPVSMEEAAAKLAEESGDVLLLLDYLVRAGLLDLEAAIASARRKNTRWYGRVIGK